MVLSREFQLSSHQSILEDYELFEHIIRTVAIDDAPPTPSPAPDTQPHNTEEDYTYDTHEYEEWTGEWYDEPSVNGQENEENVEEQVQLDEEKR